MRLYAGGEEEKSTERVGGHYTHWRRSARLTFFQGRNISRALRTDSVEWRTYCDCRVRRNADVLYDSVVLMEIGLLSEDDHGETDLGTLEKRLAERGEMSRRASVAVGAPSSPTASSVGHDTATQGDKSSPRSALTSPEPPPAGKSSEKGAKEHQDAKDPEKPEEEVEDLSDLMCSLVTNNCGETRYIGK